MKCSKLRYIYAHMSNIVLNATHMMYKDTELRLDLQHSSVNESCVVQAASDSLPPGFCCNCKQHTRINIC